MTEFLTEENIVYAGTFYSICEGMYLVMVTFYFRWISSNWLYVAAFGWFIQLLTFLVIAFWVPESPLFLLKTGKMERVKLILKEIMHFNGVENADEAIDCLENRKIPKK